MTPAVERLLAEHPYLRQLDDDQWMRRGLIVQRLRAIRRRSLRRQRGRWSW